MDAISVILPQKSTAILPHQPTSDAGYITGMALSGMTAAELNAWIDSRKLALGIKRDTDVVRRCGLPKDAVQNIRKAKNNGTHFPKIDILEKLEAGLGDEPSVGGGDGGEAALLAEIRLVKARLEGLEYALSVLRKAR